MEDILTVDVHCTNASTVPYYRLYCDGDLLTERDFVYDASTKFIRERCVLQLNEGQHKIFIGGEFSDCFTLKNAILNGVLIGFGSNGTFRK